MPDKYNALADSCFYEYEGRAYHEAQLQDIAQQLVRNQRPTAITDKYTALSGLRLSILTGIFPGGVDQILSEYPNELKALGITRQDLDTLMDHPIPTEPSTPEQAVAVPRAKQATKTPKQPPKKKGQRTDAGNARAAGTPITTEDVVTPADELVPTGEPATGAITVARVVDMRKAGNTAKFGQQRKFMQGAYAPVQIFASEELMSLISDGSQRDPGKKRRPAPKDSYILGLEKKFGMTSEMAFAEAKELAKEHRDKDTEMGIVLVDPRPAEETMPEQRKPQDPISKPAPAKKVSTAKRPIVSEIITPSDGPAPVQMVSGFIPGDYYRYRNRVMIFSHMTIGTDGKKYLHFTNPNGRIGDMFQEGQPHIQNIVHIVTPAGADVSAVDLAARVVGDDVRETRRQIDVPANTFPEFPQPIQTELEGTGPVYENVSLPINLDPTVTAMLEMLYSEDYMPLIVGGSVRDALEGRRPKDVDIEVYGITLDELAAKLKPYGSVSMVGKAFGVVAFKPSGSDTTYDFSVPRRETKSGAGTKGFDIEFDPTITIEDAASRRDFTMNAFGWNPVTKTLYDYFGGLTDMANGVMRPTSEKFDEDPLRVLRGMQFQSRLGFEISPETYAAMQAVVESGEMDTLPASRISGEFNKWATKGRHPWKIFDFLRSSGYGSKYFPELMELRATQQDPIWHPEGNVEQHTMQVLARAQEIADREKLDDTQRQVLIFSALLHDIAKPGTTKSERRVTKDGKSRMAVTAKGHEAAGALMAPKILRRMGVKQDVIDQIVPLIREHLAHASIAAISEDSGRKSAFAKLAKRLAPANVEQLMMLMEADMMGRNNVGATPPVTLGLFQQLLENYKKDNAGSLKFTPILRGRHLTTKGLKPGPLFGEVLAAAENMQLEGGFANESEALEWLSAYMATDDFIKIARKWDGNKFIAMEEPVDLQGMDIRRKFPFITEESFVEEAYTAEEDRAFRDALPAGPWKSKKEFQKFLEDGTYAMATGMNPMARALSKEANDEMNRRAVDWLRGQGLEPVPIYGKYGNSERSFIIPGMTMRQAQEFAKEFMQESVAHSNGLVYQSGEYNPRVPGSSLDPRFDTGGDFFSSVNIGGKPTDFSIDYDWDTTRTIRQQVDIPLSMDGEEHVTASYGSRKKFNKAIEAVAKEAEAVRVSTPSGQIVDVKKRSVLDTFRESGYVDLTGQQISSPQDLADLFLIHRSPSIEKSHVVYMKGDQILGYATLTVNRPNMVPMISVTEDFSNGMLPVIDRNMKAMGADGFYMLHNHPSGNPTPSRADLNVTEIFGADPRFRGHVVLDTDKFTFIDADGFDTLMEYKKKPVNYRPGDAVKVTGLTDMVNLAKQLYNGPDTDIVVLLNTHLEVVGFEHIPPSMTNAQVEEFIDTVGVSQGAISYAYLTGTNKFRALSTRTRLIEVLSMYQENDSLMVAQAPVYITEYKRPIKIEELMQVLWEPAEIIESRRFQKVLPDSVLRDEAGNPMVTYLGQRAGDNFLSKDGSLSFGPLESALSYLNDPTSTSVRYDIVPTYLDMRNPLMSDPADQFLNYTALEDALGTQEATEVLSWLSEDVENTDNWTNYFADEFASLQDLIGRDPARLRELYVPADVAFGDPAIVQTLVSTGYDSAVYADSMGNPRYQVFSKERLYPALDQPGFWMENMSDPEVQKLVGRYGFNTATIQALQKLTDTSPTAGSPMRKDDAVRFQKVLDRFMDVMPLVDVVVERPPVVERVLRYPDGRPYGGEANGIIFIADDADAASRPMREFGHVWTRAFAANNPKGYMDAMDMVEETVYMDMVDNAVEFSELDSVTRQDEALSLAMARQGAELPVRHPLRRMIVSETARIHGAMGFYGMDAYAASEVSMSSAHDLLFAEEEFGSPFYQMTEQDLQSMDSGTALRFHIASNDMRKGAGKKKLDFLNAKISMDMRALEGEQGLLIDEVVSDEDVLELLGVPMTARILNTLLGGGLDPMDIKFVPVTAFYGQKAQFLISDRLGVGEVEDGAGGARRIDGGPGFLFIKKNLEIGAAWASSNEDTAMGIWQNAADVAFITLLDESSMFSNEAVLNYYFNKLEQMDPAVQAQFVSLLQERADAKKPTIAKSEAAGKKPSEDLVAFVEMVDGVTSLKQLRAKLMAESTLTKRSAVLTDIIRAGDNTNPKDQLLLIQKNNGIPTSEEISQHLAEPGIAHIPAGYVVAAIRIDKTRPPVNLLTNAEARKELGIKLEDVHPNYPYYIFAEPVGFLERAVPAAMLSDEIAKRFDTGLLRTTAAFDALLTPAQSHSNVIKALNDKGASMNETVAERTTVSLLKFVTLLSKAFPNVPVKFQEATTRQEAVEARKENILTAQNGSVFGYFDKEGVLHLSFKELGPESAIYHYARLFLLAMKKNAPQIYARGIELITEPGNPYYAEMAKAFGKSFPAETIAEMALSKAVSDSGDAYFSAARGGTPEFYAEYPTTIGKPVKALQAQKKTAEATQLQYDMVHDQMMRYRDWLRTMKVALGKFTGITSASMGEISTMNLDEFADSMFLDMIHGRPIAVGEHTTEHLTQHDIAIARQADNLRFQRAVGDGPAVSVDRALALLHARGMEEAGADPGEIEEQTTWYRGMFSQWDYDYERTPPVFTGSVPGYEMMTRAEQAAAALNNSNSVSLSSRAAIQEQITPYLEDYTQSFSTAQDALQVFDDYVNQQLENNGRIDTMPFAMHPALAGISEYHLQNRVELLKAAFPEYTKRKLAAKYSRADNPAPVDFADRAKSVLNGKVATKPAELRRQATMDNPASRNMYQKTVNHATEASFANTMNVYGENPFRGPYVDGLYRDSTLHLAPGREPGLAALDQMLDMVGNHKNATELVYDALLVDNIVQQGRETPFEAVVATATVNTLQTLQKLPRMLRQALSDALQSLGVSKENAERYLDLPGASVRVAEWLDRAGDLSFSNAFNSRLRLQIDPDDPVLIEFLADVQKHPEISVDDWLVLVADDLYSGRLPREVFDHVMALRDTANTSKKTIGKQAFESSLAKGLQNMFSLYRERLHYMMGAIAVNNAFLLEMSESLSETEIRNLIGESAQHQSIQSILQKMMNEPGTNPAVAVQQAEGYMVDGHQDSGSMGIYGPPKDTVVLAWGLAKKKLEATKAYLEDQLEAGPDLQASANLRIVNDSIEMLTLAIFKAGSETGRALRVRQVLYSMSDATPDQYIEQIENELFGPKGQRTGKKKGLSKDEKTFIRKEYEDMLRAKEAVRRFDEAAARSTDAALRDTMMEGLRVLRSNKPLTDAELQMITEALRNHPSNSAAKRSQIEGMRMHSQVNGSNYYNNLSRLVAHLAAANPELKTLEQIYDRVKTIVPNVDKSHIAQVLYYASPDKSSKVLSSLQSQKRGLTQVRETVDKLQKEIQELINEQRVSGRPSAARDRKLKSIQNKMHQIMATLAQMEIDDVMFGKAAQDMMIMYQRIEDATTVDENGDLNTDYAEVLGALGGMSEIRMMISSSASTAEAKLDALIADAKAGNVNAVLQAMAPKPPRQYSIAELAARQRLQEKRDMLRRFYEAHRQDRTTKDKLTRGFAITAATIMATKAMIDFSMIMIQGSLVFFKTFNPLRAVAIATGYGTGKQWADDIAFFFKTLKRSVDVSVDSLRSDANKKHLLANDQQSLQNHPLYREMMAGGVDFSTAQAPGGISEELFQETWLDVMASRIYMKRVMGRPLSLNDRMQQRFFGTFKKARDASEAAFVGYLNAWRAQLFQQMYDSLYRSMGPGYVPSEADLKYIATQVNIWTGRASTGTVLDQGAVFFWAYKLMISKLRFFVNTLQDPAMAAVVTYRMSKEEKGSAEYLKLKSKRNIMAIRAADNFVGFTAWGMSYMAGRALVDALCPEGATIGTDVRQSDFLNIRCGNKMWDPTGGFTQYFRFLGRLGLKFAEGNGIVPKSNRPEHYHFNREGYFDIIFQFLQGKLTPIIGEAGALIFNQDFLGKPVHDSNFYPIAMYIVTHVFTPLFVSETVENVVTVKDDGSISMDEDFTRTPLLSALSIPAAFVGINERRLDTGKRTNSAVNEYLATIDYTLPSPKLPPALQQKNNPKVYDKLISEYNLTLTNWVRDELIAGRRPTKAQIKRRAKQLEKELERKYK